MAPAAEPLTTAAMLADLEALVRCESPSSDLAALGACADVLAALGERLLGAAPVRGVTDGRPHLLWPATRPDPVLLLGHLDTVWPAGSLHRHPFGVRDGIVTGPGCFDMKAGLVQLLHGLATVGDRAGVSVLITSDEELGSPTSRPLIEALARDASAALVLEGSAAGALKSARKGVSSFRLRVHGRAAHAGLEPERGANATVELAHQVLAITSLADPAEQTTVTPTAASAGTTANTVPAGAVVDIDVRAFTPQEQRRVAGELSRLRPVLDGTRLEVTCTAERPPLPPAASRDLLARARQVAARLGLPPVRDVAAGGGSDGNLTAGAGTPTLDGLGAAGGGAPRR